MVDLARVGRNPTDLAREFEPSRQTIQNWVAEAAAVKAVEKPSRRWSIPI